MEGFHHEYNIHKRDRPLGRFTRVSRLWNVLALKWLWRRTDLIRILGFLSPLVHLTEGWVSLLRRAPCAGHLTDSAQTFEHNPTTESITKFFRYSPLVKSLRHEQWLSWPQKAPPGVETFDCGLADEVFFHLWTIEPPPDHHGVLFPNMHTLIWYTDTIQSISQVLLFRTHRIKDLDISFLPDVECTSTIRRTLNSFGLHRSLRSLSLGFHNYETEVVPDQPLVDLIVKWVQQQGDLEKLELVRFTLRQPLHFIQSTHRFWYLRLETIIYERLPEISDFIVSVSTTCPHLEELQLTFRRSIPYAEATSSLTFETIRPLLQLQKLNELSIDCDRALPLSAADIKAMADLWPKILWLTLCPSPSPVPTTVGTPFSSLMTFASHFSTSLTRLRHFFILDETELPAHSTSFTYLGTLDIGSTSLGASRLLEVAWFIGDLCPYEFTLDWDQNGVSERAWKSVKKSLEDREPVAKAEDVT